MYLVTTRTGSKVLATEYWEELLSAEIRRDVINSKSSELEGAILEQIEIKDAMTIEVNWPDFRSLLGITVDLSLSQNTFLNFKIEVEFDVDDDFDVDFKVSPHDFSYLDEEGNEFSFTPTIGVSKKIKSLVNKLISDEDTFSQFDDETIIEANKRGFENSHQDPITL
ncbi:MAG: hypothetical protein ACJASM_002047 [Salibacteraceae bacterium]|jgi:hypothetical protein